VTTASIETTPFSSTDCTCGSAASAAACCSFIRTAKPWSACSYTRDTAPWYCAASEFARSAVVSGFSSRSVTMY